MRDPSAPVQKAIWDRLVGDAGVSAIIGRRVYDRVPQDSPFPYVSFGPMQPVNDWDQCHEPVEVFVQLDGWDRAEGDNDPVGSVRAKQLADAICQAMDEDLEPEGFDVITQEVENIRHLTDPDGLTSHAVINLRLVVTPAS